ncbi:MAG: hypothetical protein ACXWFY_06115, partial [Chthoniobacterales bacterium]
VRAPAVSVAVTGTTFILEAPRGGHSRLYLLEGSAGLSLNKHSSQKKNVRAGQMLDVPAGATKLPEPVNFNINQLMKTHPLIVGFPPLPSQGLIADAAAQQGNEPVYQGTQVGGPGPGIGVGLGGFPILVGGGGSGSHGSGHGNTGGKGTTGNPGTQGGAGGSGGSVGGTSNPGKGVSGLRGTKAPTKKAPGQSGPTIY